MLKKILLTIGTKVITAIVALLVLSINAKTFGPEGVGTIGLIILSVSLLQLANNFIGGSTIVFLYPRYPSTWLFVYSYLWAFLVSGIGFMVLSTGFLIPIEYVLHVVLLNFIYSIYSTHASVLLGREKITSFNVLHLLQFVMLIAGLLTFIFVFSFTSVIAYIYSLYFSYSLLMLISIFLVFKNIRLKKHAPNLLKEMYLLGRFGLGAGLLQLISTRLPYYFIEVYTGRAILGVFVSATQLMEGIKLISSSVGTIQYSKVSNIKEIDQAKALTIKLIKLLTLSILLILIVLLMIPESVYILFLSEKFEGVKAVLYILAPGIWALSISVLFSHFFSGIGKIRYNMISSGISAVIVLISLLILITPYGVKGAAIATSIAYIGATVFQAVVFFRKYKVSYRNLFIKKADLTEGIAAIRYLFKKQEKTHNR